MIEKDKNKENPQGKKKVSRKREKKMRNMEMRKDMID